jgi:hypothetical protein
MEATAMEDIVRVKLLFRGLTVRNALERGTR